MASIYDVDPSEHIAKVASALKELEPVSPPAWSGFVKTGVHKERPPADKEWWYMRSASILRTISKKGPIGVAKLRVKYGGRKRRGHKPSHFFKGSGNIIRKVLQQLEKAELVKQDEKNNHKGRVITPKGKSLLDKIATSLRGPKKAKPAKPKEQPKEVKAEKPKEQAAPKEEGKPEVKKEAAAPKPKEQATPKPAEPKQEAPKEQAPPKEEKQPETTETTETKQEPQKEQ